jgi:hypothetical protein
MTADWAPAIDARGRVWIGLARQQGWAYGVLTAVVIAAGALIGSLARGGAILDVALLVSATLLGAGVGVFLWRPSVTRLNGVYVSDDALEIKRGLRTTRVPWNEITGLGVERRMARGGDVVVARRPKRLVLPAPISARRLPLRAFADPDFDAKFAFLRAHLNTDTESSVGQRH